MCPCPDLCSSVLYLAAVVDASRQYSIGGGHRIHHIVGRRPAPVTNSTLKDTPSLKLRILEIKPSTDPPNIYLGFKRSETNIDTKQLLNLYSKASVAQTQWAVE